MAKQPKTKRVNLIPDVKQQRLNAQRLRRVAMSVSTVVIIVAIGIPILLLIIKGSQLLLLKRVQGQIDERKATLVSAPNIVTMLTVKDHLAAVLPLYQQRILTSKILDLIPSVLPTEVKLNDITIDSIGNVSFIGASSTYSGVEKFYKALLIAGENYDPNRVETDPNNSGLFKSVVIDSISGPAGSEVSFTIKAAFDITLVLSSGASQ